MSPHCLAAPDDAQTTPGRVGGAGRYNPGIGRPRRLAGRRLDAAGIHRQWGDMPYAISSAGVASASARHSWARWAWSA